MLKVLQEVAVSSGTAVAGGSLLDELVRDGARQMLATALLAEVAAHIEAHADLVDADGRRLVVRYGSRAEREVTTAAGALTVKAPWVNDRRIDEHTGERCRFSSAILPAWARKSPKIAEVLPLLYLHGLSSSDFTPALEQFLGSGGGSSAKVRPFTSPRRGPSTGSDHCSTSDSIRETARDFVLYGLRRSRPMDAVGDGGARASGQPAGLRGRS